MSIPPVILRAEARAAGLPKYFTGKPCKFGHIAERSVKTKICSDCGRMHRRRRGELEADKVRAEQRAWIAAHPEYKERAALRIAAWHKANPERRREHRKKWDQANPDYKRNVTASRRKRLRLAGGRYTPAEIEALLQKQRGRCANPLCRVRLGRNFHRDHVIPLSLGGTNDIGNIQLLCQPCNLSKGKKDPIAWMQSKGMLL